MDVIILDAHPVEDARIERHITYLAEQGVGVCRIHYNYTDESAKPGKFSQYGVNGFRVNQLIFQGKVRTLYFMSYCLRRKILDECRKALEALDIDPARPSVLHVHDPLLLPLAAMLVQKSLPNSRVVYDRHEVYEEWLHLGISIPIFYEGLAKKWISGTVVVSEHHLDAVRRLFPESCTIAVPNYAASAVYDADTITAKIHPDGQGEHIHAVYVGSLNNQVDRDVDLLLEIADAVIRTYDNVTFSVGGTSLDEASRVKINDLARKHGGRFRFLGYVPREKTIELTEKAHIGFLLIRPDARYWVKTSPNKIYEYLVCGTVPIVRADIDHADRLRACSLIFDRTDENEVIVQAVLDLLGSPEKLKQYMGNARESSLDYTWESVACRYIELYTALLYPGAASSHLTWGMSLNADGCEVR
ncbi:glycosyltransferase family 4 protein [Methanoculleus sp. UBA208]|uniref:glycosyltransferase family 4 protein n=1 Tax=Methanoculleus sp. UBA208 TaxID=1915494 RepID=UPI0025ECBE16|nr:glycosyltransferase family 4 protein [Methanoculleus sp. UBA208]